MKHLILILLIGSQSLLFSQNFDSKDWTSNNMDRIPYLTITKTEDLKFQNLTFKVKWNAKLSYSDNLKRHYGGIGELKIYYKNQLFQTMNNIEDQAAMETVYMYLFDFNMDGFLDFSIRAECGKSCYYNYYLYNTQMKKFIHNKEWDVLRISKINKKTKQLLTYPDDYKDYSTQTLYKIINNKLTVQKIFTY